MGLFEAGNLIQAFAGQISEIGLVEPRELIQEFKLTEIIILPVT